MILARLTRAIRRQNWFAVTLECLIVVLGVVIGFQVNDWNDKRIRNAQEGVILCYLNEEFRRIETDVLEHLADADITYAEARGIRDAALRGFQLEDIGRFSVRAVTLRAPPAGSATYDQLVSSAEMGLIRSERLRIALTEFGEHFDRHQASGRDLSNMMVSTAGPVRQVFALAPEPETLPDPLREELGAFVAGREFLLAAGSMEQIALSSRTWKQISVVKVQAVIESLAGEAVHCGGPS